jgi:4-cresol dehydrogenase (hydroxylating) flavoprotein subunit
LGSAADFILWGDGPNVAGAPIPREVLDVVHGLNMGQPIRRSAATAYWRKKVPPPPILDPDRDGCGFISFSPAVPFEGGHVRKALDVLTAIMERHGFDPSLGLNCVGERSIDLTPMILFDREIPGEDERALACHDQMMRDLGALGYYPYRLATAGMDKLPVSRDGYPQLIATLKRALDPEGILAPGRYEG